ncbi:transglutaminase-like cysteine peptidase [Cellvibrio sp. pealriver]|uniref:transglutaminase-like cysteine peptidase n=1 Tax=Cellvibrio sp. pealriver TaxID=1622269 RepID=UPI00069CD266|nr:transglutaminase-like cysteine peptidase [Cellvibrio sp. pealriver]
MSRKHKKSALSFGSLFQILVAIAVVMWLRDLRSGDDPTIANLLAQSQSANAAMPVGLENSGPAPGEVVINQTQFHYTSEQLSGLIQRYDPNPRNPAPIGGVYFFHLNGIKNATAIAPGLDQRAHIVNAFLEGFSPFAVDNVWMPLYVIAKRKHYMLDSLNYGKEELWQTSRQAFFMPHGDCEDHAIVLADWLIDMGFDARVALGKHQSDGHAWVVLVHEGKEFILEATQKSRLSTGTPYPLAATLPDYHPTAQFNRTAFWINTGSSFTTRYTGAHWVEQSHYSPLSSADNSASP